MSTPGACPIFSQCWGPNRSTPGKYKPGAILRLIQAEKVTFSHCVPTIIHILLNDPAIDDVDLTGWKVVIGGSAMPKGLCEAALARGINLFSAYGMSETCPLLTIANAKPHMLESAGGPSAGDPLHHGLVGPQRGFGNHRPGRQTIATGPASIPAKSWCAAPG